MLDMHRKKWRSKIRGWKDQILKTQTGRHRHPRAGNGRRMRKRQWASRLPATSSSPSIQRNVVCLDEDRDRLYESTRAVMKTIQNLGFSCRIETINAVEAWRGSLPGDGYSNVRRVLLAHAEPGRHAADHVGVGGPSREPICADAEDTARRLLFAATSGATPFRVNLHVSDLGHTLVVGPSGAGKSTALGLIAAQWFRYPRAQVFAFDRGYSIWMLTEAVGRRVLRSCRPEDRTGVLPAERHRRRRRRAVGGRMDRSLVRAERPEVRAPSIETPLRKP